MYDYLIDHALKNVWCAPRQDLQAIVKPFKLSQQGGNWNSVRVMNRVYQLPVLKKRFFVYQIGQLHPVLMGLLNTKSVWTKFSDACNNEKLLVDLYNNNGIQLPRTQAWYMFTEDRNLLIAVQDQPTIPFNQNTEALYLRLYSNAYFNLERANVDSNIIYVNGKTVQSADEILSIQNEMDTYVSKPGLVYGFVNGYRVNKITLVNTLPGDVVEFVYDASVYKVVNFRLGDLETFDSTLDNKGKYLIHYEGTDSGEIDYHDDIDFWILEPRSGNRLRGVYYHRNMPDAVRMLTHRDYSLVVPYVIGYIAAQTEWLNQDDLVIQMTVRQGGWDRSLVYENNRIHELYKLDELEIKQALLGVNSSLINWRADVLEAADYAKLMRVPLNEVTRPLVESGYGYNAISVILGDTPRQSREQSGQEVIDVPYGLQHNSTCYEYDEDGKLIGWHQHTAGRIYAVYDDRTKLVEQIAGTGSAFSTDVIGEATQTLSPTTGYRMYVCDVLAGVPQNNWRDVTGSGLYAVANNQLTWFTDPDTQLTMVRSDANHLIYSVNLDIDDGILEFSLTQQHQLQNGVFSKVMTVPMGVLDLFLNDRPIIEGIDYIVDFPKVVVFNKEYLVNAPTGSQKITVRFSGFAKSDLAREIPSEVGFVHHGLLSRNNRFDLRDDKVMRIVADGALYHRGELRFAESHPGIQIDARNGSPYVIRDIVVPTRGATGADTYALREQSQIIDKRVSDYLTLRNPQPTDPFVSPIPNRYKVFSPFCCNVLYDLKAGIIDDERLKEHYNDSDVEDILADYLYLLRFDPTQPGNEIDDRFCVIHAHNLDVVIDLDIYHYKFIQRVVNLYMNDKVELSGSVRLLPIA